MGGPWYVDRKTVMGNAVIKEEKFTDGSYRENDPIVAIVSVDDDAEWIVELYNRSRRLNERGSWVGQTGGVAKTDVRKPNPEKYEKK